MRRSLLQYRFFVRSPQRSICFVHFITSLGGCDSFRMLLAHMRMTHLITMLASGILCSLAQSPVANTVDGFSKLAFGDTLQMRFTSKGCFHSYTYDVTFTRKVKPTASVTAVTLEWVGPGATYRDGKRRELGTLSLTESDLAGLDALLAFYRSNTNRNCTTKDSIKITWVRDGKVIATEEFTDPSCDADDLKGVLTIPSLAQRLPKGRNNR